MRPAPGEERAQPAHRVVPILIGWHDEGQREDVVEQLACAILVLRRMGARQLGEGAGFAGGRIEAVGDVHRVLEPAQRERQSKHGKQRLGTGFVDPVIRRHAPRRFEGVLQMAGGQMRLRHRLQNLRAVPVVRHLRHEIPGAVQISRAGRCQRQLLERLRTILLRDHECRRHREIVRSSLSPGQSEGFQDVRLHVIRDRLLRDLLRVVDATARDGVLEHPDDDVGLEPGAVGELRDFQGELGLPGVNQCHRHRRGGLRSVVLPQGLQCAHRLGVRLSLEQRSRERD